jgi:hypothetical protein
MVVYLKKNCRQKTKPDGKTLQFCIKTDIYSSNINADKTANDTIDFEIGVTEGPVISSKLP